MAGPELPRRCAYYSAIPQALPIRERPKRKLQRNGRDAGAGPLSRGADHGSAGLIRIGESLPEFVPSSA